MIAIPAIAIFDIGKTNKKLLLFDEQYKLVYEESIQFPETVDEDGFPCEDLSVLEDWLQAAFSRVSSDRRFQIKALNFSGYGASLVYLDAQGQVIPPLYNYLKPYPLPLQQQFYNLYGGEKLFARQTASPVLGNLNSGMQLYRLKYEKPLLFRKIQTALHLPQYLSYIFSAQRLSDITSVGCHTNLWNFENNRYHDWVVKEGVLDKLAPLGDCSLIAGYGAGNMAVGTGIHDSSAALIPYLTAVQEPFILLSTGTWCISLNPFNDTPLTDLELAQDCLCYLTYQGKPVKASRLFAGHEHEQQIKLLATHFNKPPAYYTSVQHKPESPPRVEVMMDSGDAMLQQSAFAKRSLGDFSNYEDAYHQLMADIMVQQLRSTALVIKGTTVQKIVVDGGFSKNEIYMNLLAAAFPNMKVYAATVAQASALGAAMAIHPHWNNSPLPADSVELRQIRNE